MIEAVFVGSSCDCAVTVKWLADVTVGEAAPLIEQLLPTDGAVTSTQCPLEDDRVAPPVTVQLTAAVAPPVTVANSRRTLPGSTLKPYSGSMIAMEVTGAATAERDRTVELARFPETPETVRAYVPGDTWPEVESVSRLLEVVTDGLNVALMPVGAPETERLTFPAKPFCPVTLMVVLAGVLPIRCVNEAEDDERLKPGAIIVRTTVALAVAAPEVPVTVIG